MTPVPGRLVEVAVAAQVDRPERTFQYRMDEADAAALTGALVLVPYGRRQAIGYLLGDALPEEAVEAKSVLAVLSGPMLAPDLITVAREAARYYRAPVGAVLAAALPPGIESRLRRSWEITGPEGAAVTGRAVGEVVSDRQAARLGRAQVARLRQRGALTARWQLDPPRAVEQRLRTVSRTGRDGIPRGPLQRDLLAETPPTGDETLAAIAARLGRDPATLVAPAGALERDGYLHLGWRAVVRDPLEHRPVVPGPMASLAAEQAAAVEAIDQLSPGGRLLLEGIAASGKTDVYLAAIGATLRAGRGAIVLVPELSLVAQLADRLRAAFGDELAALHSALSEGERHDQWWRIRRGEASVVIGTRGAVFAPVVNLGLIIIDEAHDGGYKSDRTPRSDARWLAARRAVAVGARLVLGTATPNVVSLAEAEAGQLHRVRLRERRVGVAPRIEIVDLRAELGAGNRSILSSRLAEALDALEPGRDQAILFINRRGAATFVLCRDCGTAATCPDCGLPYVHHLSENRLRCHHCGRRAPVPVQCSTCGSGRIRYFGAGTQRVEAEVAARFGQLRIGRLDSDMMDRRRGFEAIYDDFREGRLDLLVGTQLAAHGLDLPAVVLVAVIAADVTLHLPDYRAAERTFQLVAQVAGRAGRGERTGRVIVQTYAPDHHAIVAAAALDTDAFARTELPRRRTLGYPPYRHLARLLVADPDRARAELRAQAAADAARAAGVDVQGPLPAWVPRRAGQWRYQVVLRAANIADRQRALERIPAGIGIDVDPESLL